MSAGAATTTVPHAGALLSRRAVEEPGSGGKGELGHQHVVGRREDEGPTSSGLGAGQAACPMAGTAARWWAGCLPPTRPVPDGLQLFLLFLKLPMGRVANLPGSGRRAGGLRGPQCPLEDCELVGGGGGSWGPTGLATAGWPLCAGSARDGSCPAWDAGRGWPELQPSSFVMPGPAGGAGAAVLAQPGGQLVPLLANPLVQHAHAGRPARHEVQEVFTGAPGAPALLPSAGHPLPAVAGVEAHLLEPCSSLALGVCPQPLGTVPIPIYLLLPPSPMRAWGLPWPRPLALLLPLPPRRGPAVAPQDGRVPGQLQAEHRTQGKLGARGFWVGEAEVPRGCPALGINVPHQRVPDVEQQLAERGSSSPRPPIPPAALLRPRVAGAMALLGLQGAGAHDALQGQQPGLLGPGPLPPLQAVEEGAGPSLGQGVGGGRRPAAGCRGVTCDSGRTLPAGGFPSLHLRQGTQRRREVSPPWPEPPSPRNQPPLLHATPGQGGKPGHGSHPGGGGTSAHGGVPPPVRCCGGCLGHTAVPLPLKPPLLGAPATPACPQAAEQAKARAGAEHSPFPSRRPPPQAQLQPLSQVSEATRVKGKGFARRSQRSVSLYPFG